MKDEVGKKFEKCANYSVLGTVVINTLTSMSRFAKVPQDKLIQRVYNRLREKASA
jgi:hypothetical protein